MADGILYGERVHEETARHTDGWSTFPESGSGEWRLREE